MYWDKGLFLPGILCLGTGIKSCFCLGSCVLVLGYFCLGSRLGTGINGYFFLGSCV